MSDPPLTECSDCGGELRRVLFPPAVVYKGSGFYTTDYKNAGRSAAEKPTTESKVAESTSSDSPAKSSESPSSPAPAKGSE